MTTMNQVALLRGINVGGRNKVRMADLRAAFETFGAIDVETYIQSGNVLFASGLHGDELESGLAAMLESRFGLAIPVVTRTHDQLRAVVDGAPAGFGGDDHRCDVVFLKAPLTADEVIGVVELRDGVDRVWPGDGVLYFARLAERASQSRLSKLVSRPEYQLMTIRNWRTTTTLLERLDARSAE